MIGVAAVAQQDLVQGLEVSRLLALDIGPLWGLLFIAAGLALCLIGYYLYRFMVALSAAVAGSALLYLFAPGFGMEGLALWTTVVGVAIVLIVIGYLLYDIAVFLTGAAAGLALGVAFWLMGSSQFATLAPLSETAIARENIPAVVATGIPFAIGLGLVALKWERRMITLLAVLLGAVFITLGIRIVGPPEALAKWTPALAGIAFLGGLYLNTRVRREHSTAGRSRPGTQDRRSQGHKQQQRSRSVGRPQPAAARRAP